MDREDVFSLPEGRAVIQYPEHLSQASYDDFVAWLQIIIKKTKRLIRADEKPDAKE